MSPRPDPPLWRHWPPRRHAAALLPRIPIANAVLTVENEAQAWARTADKGRDAARVAVEMANLMEDLS